MDFLESEINLMKKEEKKPYAFLSTRPLWPIKIYKSITPDSHAPT